MSDWIWVRKICLMIKGHQKDKKQLNNRKMDKHQTLMRRVRLSRTGGNSDSKANSQRDVPIIVHLLMIHSKYYLFLIS